MNKRKLHRRETESVSGITPQRNLFLQPDSFCGPRAKSFGPGGDALYQSLEQKMQNAARTNEPNFRRLHLTLIGVILIVYLFSARGYLEIVDTSYSVETAISLFDHGSLEIPSQGAGNGWIRAANGKLYSKYGLGLPLLYLPYVAMGTGLSEITKLPREDLINFLVSFSNIPFAITTLFLFSSLVRKFDISERSVCFLTVALGLGTLCWRYAAYDYSEQVQMALLTLAVSKTVRPTGRDLIWAGLSCAGLLVLKLIYLLLLPIFILYLLFQLRGSLRIKAMIQFSLPLLFAIGFIAWANTIRFGNPFESGYGSEADRFSAGQILDTIAPLILSIEHGLLPFCPILLLGLLGWPAFFRKQSSEARFCAGLILVNLLWSAAWIGWDGGWAWGPRLLVPLLPLWLLPAAFFIDEPGRLKWFPAFVVLLGFSVTWQMPGILVKDQEIHWIKKNRIGQRTRAEVAGMPSDLIVSWMLLAHKLSHAPEVYRLGDLTSTTTNPDRLIDFTSYRTFQGFNIWTEQTSRQFQKPAIRWLPLFGLAGIVGLLASGLRRRAVPAPSVEETITE